MLPCLRGWKRSRAQPGTTSLPRIHSFVSHVAGNRRLADSHFQRRDERLHEVELPDRANIFAKRRARKEAVNDKGRHDVTNGNPGRQPRAVPQRERS